MINNAANRYVLDNGMVVILEEKRSSPAVAIQGWVKSGSINEKTYMGSGISHFVEHMLFKGTEKRKIGQIAKEIREAGGNLNGFTSFEFTGYPIVVDSSFFKNGIDVISDVLMNSSFDPSECEKEREVILKEINMGVDDVDKHLSNFFFSNLFRTHPYGSPVIGYREIFSKITRDELLDYYKANYIPNNAVLVVVGDINEKEALETIKEYFAPWERKSIQTIDAPIEPIQRTALYAEKAFPTEIVHINMGFHTISINHPDLFAMDTLATILGKGASSRLVERVKNKDGLVYSIGCSSYTPKYPGLFYIHATTSEENMSRAIEAIREELYQLKDKPISSEELEKAKNQAASYYVFEHETMEQKAMELVSNEVLAGDYKFSEIYLEGIMSVTSQDIAKIADIYFDKNKETTCVLRPERKEKKEEKKSPFQKIKKDTKVVLPNGITLLLKENKETPLIFIQVLLMGGVKFENKNNNGIFNILHYLLDKGTKRRSASEIALEIDNLGMEFDSYGGNNSFGCSIKVIKKDIEAGVDLLGDMLLNSTFPEEEFNKIREILKGKLKSAEDELLFIVRRKLFELLFSKHPYRFLAIGSLESIDKINRDSVAALRDEFVIGNNIVISVCGDFDTDQMQSLIEKTFANIPKKSLPKIDTPKELFPIGSIQNFIHKKKQQTVLIQGYPGMSVASSDRYIMEVITSVLSGMGGRLFSHIRDKLGLVYYVGAYNQMGVDPGAYVFYLGTTKENMDTARNALAEEITLICEVPVPEEELVRVKSSLIGNKKISLQKNSSQAFEVALDELYGLGYENPEKYSERIESVSQDDILRVAKRYFTVPCVEVTAGA